MIACSSRAGYRIVSCQRGKAKAETYRLCPGLLMEDGTLNVITQLVFRHSQSPVLEEPLGPYKDGHTSGGKDGI